MSIQVSDNPSLLKKMMDDMEQADKFYKPTKYWNYGEKRFLPELYSRGLYNFRRRKKSVLTYFWATDLKIKPEIRHRFAKKPFVAFAEALNFIFTRSNLITPGLSQINPEEITPYFYTHVKKKFASVGWNIKKCPTSKVGNPEDLVEIDGSLWTMSHLQHCSMIADAARFIPFSQKMIYFGLGEGLGRTAEILGQLYKGATFILTDIPPQLYVCNQYLKKIYPSRIIDYSESVKLDPKKSSTLNRIKGKVVILPPWKMPEWQLKISIFWNSASFQEMEPNVVVNYLNLVKKMNPEWVYINALPKGNTSNKAKGSRATKRPIKDSYYIQTLKDKYILSQKYETDYFLWNQPYFSYIFRKKWRS